MKTYSEKLKDPRWQKMRLQIMARDQWMCLRCFDAKNNLQVHHKKYIPGREPWEYDFSNFETLCEKCHEKTHGLEKSYEVVQLIGPTFSGDSRPEVIQSIDNQILDLRRKLKEDISEQLQEEVLANIVYLQQQRKSLLEK